MLKLQEKVQDQLSTIGIIPVIKLKRVQDALPLAKALIAGNLPAAEVTFRAKDAELVIQYMTRNFPEMIVGAGTVLTLDQVKLAVDSGAAFIVSPGYDEEIVTYCVTNNIPVFPGCITPTEIQCALKHQLKVIKFFPASQYGGLKTINALAGPFSGIQFMPTGGISLDNLQEYVANKNVAACGGSYMVKESLIDNKDWIEITNLCTKSVEIIKNVRG